MPWCRALAPNTAGGLALASALLSFALLAPLPARAARGIPAFPGAEGGGAGATGGRGGVVHEVTNLRDSGPGSLRACVAATGPRTCVFRTGGVIRLESPLRISNPFLSIAGQTAPGGGIALYGKGLPLKQGKGCKRGTGDVIKVSTHDVVIRFLRIWKGANPDNDDPSTKCGGSAIALDGGASTDVIVDHCTLLWAQDKTFLAAWGWGQAPPHYQKNITLSWSILAEAIIGHSVHVITGAATPEPANHETDIDFHHNYLISASHRNPLLKNMSTRWINNVVFNWRLYASRTVGGVHADFVGNVYVPGPSSGERRGGHPIAALVQNNGTGPTGSPSLYVADNVGPISGGTQWALMTAAVDPADGENGEELGPLDPALQRSAPLPAGTTWTGRELIAREHGFPIAPHRPPPSVDGGASLLDAILGPGGSGASRKLNDSDCTGGSIEIRDDTERRLVGSWTKVTNTWRGGTMVNDEAEVGGAPSLSAGTPCADSDHDGMPDAWEIAHRLDPRNPTDGRRIGPDGYTNLEHYLNGL